MTPSRILGALLLMAASAIVTSMPSGANPEDPKPGDACTTEYLGEEFEGELQQTEEGLICDLDCPDIEPITNVDLTLDGDPHGLDGDNDGIGCDEDESPSSTTTTTQITPPAVPDAVPAQPVLAEPSFTG